MSKLEVLVSIIDELIVLEQTVTLETKLFADLELDSLDYIEIVMGFEDHYNIEIPDEDLEDVVTVADLLNIKPLAKFS